MRILLTTCNVYKTFANRLENHPVIIYVIDKKVISVFF